MSRNGRPRKSDGTVFTRTDSAVWWVRYRDREGSIIKESTGTSDRQQADSFLRDRLGARDDGTLSTVLTSKKLTFNEWTDWFLERRSKPPFRSRNTHAANLTALKKLRPVFGTMLLADITPEAIEDHLWRRLGSDRYVHTKLGMRRFGKIKPATVHQEFRVLTRIPNVAVMQKRLAANPCDAVEFPVSVSRSTRKPHYMTASEQMRIEFCAPSHLRNAIVILVETGLRPFKELLPMKKSQIDLENSLVYISDSKTPNGVGDMPMTELACQAFQSQIESTPESEYLFPPLGAPSSAPHLTSLKKSWAATLRRAGVPYFPIYHLRHTFATRLSAGGVADHFVTQMLRQGDAKVFRKYSQAKLLMMRESLEKLDRQANEHSASSGTVAPN